MCESSFSKVLVVFLLTNVFILFFSYFVIDGATALIACLFFLFGVGCIFLFRSKSIRETIFSFYVYQIMYVVGIVYIYACYFYMTGHGYSHLLAADIDNYFIPRVTDLLRSGDIYSAMVENWDGYQVFSRFHQGYFAYLLPFAYLNEYLGANFYISMQLSTLLIGGISGVVIFKIFLQNDFPQNDAFKYAVIVCVFSVVFFYSTQMLRDAHVMLTYLLAIYFSFRKEFLLSQVFKLVLVVIVSCTLRIETGLFLFSIIPVYLFCTLRSSKNKSIALIFSFFAVVVGAYFLIVYSNDFLAVFSQNNEYYLDSSKGDGVVGGLQKIPFFGNFLSIIYNAVQPMPLWTKYAASSADPRPEIYNPMTFPLSFSSFLNWVVIVLILLFVVDGGVRKRVSCCIKAPFRYQLYLGLVFLFMQAFVIDQRRLMAYYVVFYVFAFFIYNKLPSLVRQRILFFAISSFAGLQFMSFVYKV